MLNAILSIVVMIPFDTLNNRLFFIGPLNAVKLNAVEFVFDLKTSAAQASKCTNNRHAVDITALFVDLLHSGWTQIRRKSRGNPMDDR